MLIVKPLPFFIKDLIEQAVWRTTAKFDRFSFNGFIKFIAQQNSVNAYPSTNLAQTWKI